MQKHIRILDFECSGCKQQFNYVLFVLLCVFQTFSYANDTLVFNVTGQPPLNTEKQDGFMDEVSREALRRIGYELIINRLPAERGLRSANNGLIDGEMSRVKGLERIYENLVQVPEKIMNWEFSVFSSEAIDLQQGWNSLENKNVAFITGWKILEKNVPKSAIVTKTKDSQELFLLLKKQRTKYVVYERWAGNYLRDQLELSNVKLQSPALATKEMFMYLHKRHQDLVPKLSRALADMKQDGSYDELASKYLKNYH